MAAWLLLGACTSVAPAQGARVPREVVVLSSTRQDDRASGIADAVHERFEMPLNHLGLVVRSRNLRDGEPDDVDPARVRAIVTWFRGDEIRPPWLWPWLRRQARQPGLRFVHLGSLVPLGLDLEHRGSKLPAWLSRFGLQHADSVIEDPLRIEVEHAERCSFEARPVFTRAHHGPRNTSTRNDVWLTTRLRGHPDAVRHPVVTGPWGGIALAPYVFRDGGANGAFRWFIDPFRFFRDALGMRGVPAPDPCVHFGRRVFVLHIEGKGFEVQSTIDRGRSCGGVFLSEVVDRYEIPMAIGLSVRSLTSDLRAPTPTPEMKLARTMLNRAWVEPASQGVLRPRNWRNDSEPSYPQIENYELSMVGEVRESIRFLNEHLLAPDRECNAVFWSGAANPREDVLRECERLAAWNYGGGSFRFDAAFDSVGYVPPWGRQVGERFQVYCGSGDEDLFPGFHSTMPRAFGHADETLRRTGSPRILKPANIHTQFTSAERATRLRVLQDLIQEWAFDAGTIPVPVSTYARAVHSAHQQCRIERTAAGWAFTDFGHCRCVRIDAETRAVDWDRSPGIVGARRIGEDLFVQLGGPRAELVLHRRPTPRPHVVQSDHVLARVARTPRGVRCSSTSRRPRTIVFGGFRPRARLRLTIGETTEEVRADREGRYRFVRAKSGPVEVELQLR